MKSHPTGNSIDNNIIQYYTNIKCLVSIIYEMYRYKQVLHNHTRDSVNEYEIRVFTFHPPNDPYSLKNFKPLSFSDTISWKLRNYAQGHYVEYKKSLKKYKILISTYLPKIAHKLKTKTNQMVFSSFTATSGGSRASF